MSDAVKGQLGTIEREKPVAREIKGLGTVYLRCPSFGDWYTIIEIQNRYDGTMLPADGIAKTIAACLVTEDGQRLLTFERAGELLEYPHAVVMELYSVCVEEILRIKKKTKEETAGN